MFYKNVSSSVKTFYGVTFKPGETKEVSGFINNKFMIREDEPPVVASKNTQQKPSPEKAKKEEPKKDEVKPAKEELKSEPKKETSAEGKKEEPKKETSESKEQKS